MHIGNWEHMRDMKTKTAEQWVALILDKPLF